MTRKNLSKLINDLRSYQADLLAQNSALQYSRIAAEGASERFESLFSNVPLALMVVDEFGMVVQSNAMALQLFRPTEKDPPLNFLLPLIRGDHTARVEQAFAIAKLEGQSDTTEVTFSSGLENSFTGDLHIARIQYSHDDQPYFVCAIIDQGPLLTERRALNERRRALQESAAALQQRNEELRLSQNRLAAIINSSLDPIICVDSDQRITVFNPAAATLFHCPPEQALNTRLDRFLPNAAEAISVTEVASHAMLGEVSGRTADGKSLTLEVSVSCERHPEGDITTVFARDLTARKQVEAHRNALETQLRESHKMQAIGTMAGGIAHDFNNILGAILGNVELAKQDAGVESPAMVSLIEIEKAGRRARDLVRQILTFSRNESPKRSPIQLADVVQETARLLKVTLPPTAELQVRLKETPHVLADATQVEQALINLCTNAIQAIGGNKGTVSIELGSGHPDQLECERLGIEPGPYAILSVRDTGSGMEAETLQRIFEPFFTTKPVGQGTGLGLAVVHGVMRTHLGTVDVSSIPGAGSVFTLYFPAASSGTAPAAAEPPKPEVIKGQGRHVMYVDDDQALVFLVERALGRRGFKVSAFTDPRQALAVLRACPDDFDLLVTDYNMPGFSGVELLHEARQIRPDMPVALASGYVTPEIEQDALAAGALALIHKPNDVGDLCDTVQRLLQSEAAL
jgi:PAS domain S-box-containing protein